LTDISPSFCKLTTRAADPAESLIWPPHHSTEFMSSKAKRMENGGRSTVEKILEWSGLAAQS
jgi:hypothetical protein